METRREVSPSYDVSAEDFLQLLSAEELALAERVRAQKRAGERPVPSRSLIDRSSQLDARRRAELLDWIARMVDENVLGRSEMCIQFSALLQRALSALGLEGRVARGTAIYYAEGREVFRWEHVWVRVGDEVIDGNADAMGESLAVPAAARAAPYWGPLAELPPSVRLRERWGAQVPYDRDVDTLWWPELSAELGRLAEG